ncbi:MAG: hypothetical protein LBS27_12315 [Bifidobacteriaceae bacterium]|jgi:hypothetical protein|nr:hypothetical protein [Bifidobacteriaceae bacterium]
MSATYPQHPGGGPALPGQPLPYGVAPGPAALVAKKKGVAGVVGLVLAAVATAGIGLAAWACLATIRIDPSPFDTAKWWLLALLLLAAAPVVAIVFCIVGLVKGAHRVMAGIGLGLAVVGPMATLPWGFSAGVDSLARTAAASSAQIADGVDYGRDQLLEALEEEDVELPDWARSLLEIGAE